MSSDWDSSATEPYLGSPLMVLAGDDTDIWDENEETAAGDRSEFLHENPDTLVLQPSDMRTAGGKCS